MHGAFSQLMDTHLYSLKAAFHYCICFAAIIETGMSAKQNVWSGVKMRVMDLHDNR